MTKRNRFLSSTHTNYRSLKSSSNKEEFDQKIMEPALNTDQAVQADSWEELADLMKTVDSRIEGDTLKATVDRYNELCDLGEDIDFCKLPKRMISLKNPPYYAFWITGSTIGTLDGVRVNENLEVIRADGSTIKGLYASGNDQGGFYGMSYPWYYGGLNCGRSMTFAWLAGKHAATR